MFSIHSICVCGAGTMGSGIAQLCAQSGFQTKLYDLDKSMLQKAASAIRNSLESLVRKEKISAAQKDQALGLIEFADDINSCKADLLIEAIIEKEESKVALFKQLAEINSDNALLASNTSSLSITSIANQLANKENIFGLHFFNPAAVMRLIEVVRTKYNSQSLIDAAVSFASQLGKSPVVCSDAPGFIVNHVARPYYLEALSMVEAGYSDIETLDELLEASGFKMGPFRLMDLIGNDINYAVSCSVYEALGKPERLKPSGIQKQKVEDGELGKKTGKGYYKY
jgi:3-hydroxybutyryl-CoA dehydrogenase